MKNVFRSVLMVAAACVVLQLTGCNTVEGAGKDAERAGEKVQDVAHDAKN